MKQNHETTKITTTMIEEAYESAKGVYEGKRWSQKIGHVAKVEF